MKNLETSQSNQVLRPVRLGLATGLAVLLVGILLWGLRGVSWAHASPGTLYVDGATGGDTGDCQDPTAPCQTIGYAIAQAGDTDAILITAGTYNENLEVSGKDLTIRGGYTISGTQWLTRTGTTVVDGSQVGRTFVVHDGSDVTLEDVTITGGVAPEDACWGGGVQVTNGSATLRRTIVQGNQAMCTSGQSGGGAGGGLNAVFDEGPASLFVEDSFILDNLAGDHGSAVGTDHVTVVLTNVVIAGNNYNQLAVHMSDLTLVNSTIADNAVDGSPILDFDSASSITVLNSIVWNSGSIACGGGGGTCDITYSDIEGGWTGAGNIDADPLFVDAANGDYHLQMGSPAIDAGTPAGAPTHDIEGTPRDAAPDMGAYEWTGLRVGLVSDAPTVEDQGFNWFSHQGLVRAQSELGVMGTVYTSTSSADFLPNLQSCVDDGNTLCISVGFGMRDATWSAAQSNSGTYFAIVDVAWEDYPDNLRGTVFAEDQVGYLAGTLAGLMTQSDVIGDIGGMQIPPVERLVESYRNGAQCANSNVDVLVNYTGTFGDPGLGSQVAQGMIAQAADVIFAPAGPTGVGALLAATQSGVWGIGVDMDMYITVFDNGTVAGSDKLLTSAMKRLDNAVYNTIADVVSGTFTSGTVLYDVANDGVGLAPFHEADPFVPQATRDALESVRQGITGGTIDVDDPCRTHIYLPLIMRTLGLEGR